MSRTVTALYDTRAEAEAACSRLNESVDVDGRARIIDQSSMQGSGQQQEQQASSDFEGLSISDEDRHSYGEGIRRGGFMLCAEVDGDEKESKIVSILKETARVDLDDRQTSWKKEGWSPYQSASATGMAGERSMGSDDQHAADFSGSEQLGEMTQTDLNESDRKTGY